MKRRIAGLQPKYHGITAIVDEIGTGGISFWAQHQQRRVAPAGVEQLIVVEGATRGQRIPRRLQRLTDGIDTECGELAILSGERTVCVVPRSNASGSPIARGVGMNRDEGVGMRDIRNGDARLYVREHGAVPAQRYQIGDALRSTGGLARQYDLHAPSL